MTYIIICQKHIVKNAKYPCRNCNAHQKKSHSRSLKPMDSGKLISSKVASQKILIKYKLWETNGIKKIYAQYKKCQAK